MTSTNQQKIKRWRPSRLTKSPAEEVPSIPQVSVGRKKMRFIDNFEVLLLDQGGTFMFGNDRFGSDVDYFPTYKDLGGNTLERKELNGLINDLFQFLLSAYSTPSRFDSFPTISEAIVEYIPNLTIKKNDIARIAEVFSIFEIGSISERHIQAVRKMAESHRLGILSNIWGPSPQFEENLRQSGIRNCFERIVWSSDLGLIKPSQKIFRTALESFQVPTTKILFIGDDPMRDIVPAKRHNCGAAWIKNTKGRYPTDLQRPDITIRHLDELLEPNKTVVSIPRSRDAAPLRETR